MALPPPSAPNPPAERQLKLRREAEARAARDAGHDEALDTNARLEVLHELRVHQIELEMQNEELQRAQLELDTTRARYFELYDLAPVGYCSLSETGLIIEANLAAVTLLGMTRQLIMGRAFLRFVVREDQAALHKLLHSVELGGAQQSADLRLLRNDGSLFWAQLVVSRARNEAGATEQRVVLTDITERKRLHAALAQTDRLASMGMLAAGVGHEINNPLTYVLSNLDRLVDELPSLKADPAQLSELVETARSAQEGVGRIKNISRSLNAFSRVEQLELTDVDLNQSLQRAAAMATLELKFRATLVTELSTLPNVRVAEGRLTQVFLNLIINAAQAIEEGHVAQNTVTLRTWARGHDVFAEVKDTGRGIAAEDLERIFEPFFTTKPLANSGLGLSICKSIVTELGGDLRVESTRGRGSSFIVRLSSTLATPLPAPRVEFVGRATGRGRILVVDDEPSIRKMIHRLLEREHELVSVASGVEAKALLEVDHAFDLILCDLMMPEMTGMELHVWLTRHRPALARRVVFISGGAFTPHAAEYLESVDNLELTKPFELVEFRRVVALMMSERGE